MAKDFMPLRLWLPYGLWKTADNSEVLFNRNYNPIWCKSADGEVSKANPYSYIKFNEQIFFHEEISNQYGSSYTHWDSKSVVRKAKETLEKWGIQKTDYPLNCLMFEKALIQGNGELITESFRGREPNNN